MAKPFRKLIIAALVAAWPAAGMAQDFSSYCLGELSARGFSGYDISNVQPRGNNVRGIMRVEWQRYLDVGKAFAPGATGTTGEADVDLVSMGATWRF